MKNRLKNIQRSILRPKLHRRCKCKGMICARSHVLFSYGINNSNNERILLKDVKVEDILIDHIWIRCKELNDIKRFKIGLIINFNALVSSYQKAGGRVGIGLADLQNIEIIN